MDEIEFTVNGQRLRLTRQQVVASLRDQLPEPLQTWAVEIQGRLYPVKQVMANATGLRRTDFISHRARDVLGRLGFRVVNVEDRPTNDPLIDLDTSSRNGAGVTSVRLSALQLAVQWAGPSPEAPIGDVLRAAEAFEAWLIR